MSDEISNKSLAILLVVAISVSLVGTIVSLNRLSQLRAPGITGFATDTSTGTAQVYVGTTASLKFSTNDLDFGTIAVNTTLGQINCSVWSGNSTGGKSKSTDGQCDNQSTGPGAWTNLEIENDGNTNVTITMVSDVAAAAMIGGENPKFALKGVVNETGSCKTIGPILWEDVNTTAMDICTSPNGLDWVANNDSIDIAFNLTIPWNAAVGSKTATLTATGTSV